MSVFALLVLGELPQSKDGISSHLSVLSAKPAQFQPLSISQFLQQTSLAPLQNGVNNEEAIQ